MKITKNQLKQIIKEELQKVLLQEIGNGGGVPPMCPEASVQDLRAATMEEIRVHKRHGVVPEDLPEDAMLSYPEGGQLGEKSVWFTCADYGFGDHPEEIRPGVPYTPHDEPRPR